MSEKDIAIAGTLVLQVILIRSPQRVYGEDSREVIVNWSLDVSLLRYRSGSLR